MKTFCVILFAIVVAVSSAARLPVEKDTAELSLDKDKYEEELPMIFEYFKKIAKSDKITDPNYEEFRQKPMNLKTLVEKIEEMDEIKKEQQKAADHSDNEEEQKEDSAVEEAIDMAKEDESDVQVSFGLPEPIDSVMLKKSIGEVEEGDDDDDDDENESIIPKQAIKEADQEEEVNENDVQISFGLAEPIEARNFEAQIDADDEDDDDDDVEMKSTDLKEKVLLEVIKTALQKFAKAYNLKL